jgi:asparagine synthase (glutamine-hydrolysing)
LCGFVGIITNFPERKRYYETIIRRANAFNRRRGPDEEKYFSDPSGQLFLGFCRLALSDLSTNGSQPMISRDGKFVLVFNGEIYNHRHLRKMLEVTQTISWRGSSDSETLLEALCCWGVDDTLKNVKGMFAFALYDLHRRSVTLARDRFGQKPLYFGYVGSGDDSLVAFSSDMRCISSLEYFDPVISQPSLRQYLTYGYIAAPNTIYESIFKLEAGTLVEIDINAVKQFTIPENFSRYIREVSPPRRWILPPAFKESEPVRSLSGYVEDLRTRLIHAVDSQISADRAVGCFLSGGVDSSLICSIARRELDISLDTFSVGSDVSCHDESFYSRRAALHLNTRHHELLISEERSISDAFAVFDVYGEPFADSSQIPTTALSEYASKYVTVCLGGDGADELFGGYTRHAVMQRADLYFRIIAHLPKPLWELIAAGIDKLLTTKILRTHFTKYNRLSDYRISRLRSRIGLLGDPSLFYHSLLSQNPELIQLTGHHSSIDTGSLIDNVKHFFQSTSSILNASQLADINLYLQNDILHKVDSASMYSSLEVRSPFLDEDVASFALGLPNKLRVGSQTKFILRQLLSEYLPRDNFDRPKAGFSVPIERWLNTSLRGKLLESLRYLCELGGPFAFESTFTRVNSGGKVNPSEAYYFWSLVMLSEWLKRNPKRFIWA